MSSTLPCPACRGIEENGAYSARASSEASRSPVSGQRETRNTGPYRTSGSASAFVIMSGTDEPRIAAR